MSYATQTDFNDMKQRFNVVINFCLSLQNSLKSEINSFQNRIDGLQDVCQNLNTAVNSVRTETQNALSNLQQSSESSGSSSTTSAETTLAIVNLSNNLNALNNQLDATIEYLSHWCNNGNVNMDDLRITVGSKLKFDTTTIPTN